MRELEVMVPANKVPLIKEFYDNQGFSYKLEEFNDLGIITITLENNQTAAILEQLKVLGVGNIFGKIILRPIQLEISSLSKPSAEKSRSISVDEMISNIKDLALLSPSYVILVIIAGILAAFGLVYDNVIVVIASMIIAPLLGPLALAVLGTLIPKNIYSKKAILTEFVGIILVIFIGILVGLIFKVSPNDLPTQISIRTQPGIGDIAFAIGSGLAAGVFIIRGENTNIIGVAVAASLCPPAANVGVLLANGLFKEALGSFVLLILNVMAIYFSCALIFWTTQTIIKGGTVSARQFKKISRRYYIQIALAMLILIAIVVAIIFLYEIHR